MKGQIRNRRLVDVGVILIVVTVLLLCSALITRFSSASQSARLYTMVSAGAFTVKSVDGCPWVRNDRVAPTTKTAPTKTTTSTPKRTMTLEEAVELGVLQTPAKRTTNPFVRNG